MDEIDRRVGRYLSKVVSGESELRAELRSHIEAMMEEAMIAGVPPPQALDEALRALGEPAVLGRTFTAAYSPRVLTGNGAAPQLAIAGHGPRNVRHRLPWVALIAAAAQLQVLLFLYLQP